MDWLDLLAVQGTLKSLLQHHSSKASILWHSAFFTVQISHLYMTTGKTVALTRQTFVSNKRCNVYIIGMSAKRKEEQSSEIFEIIIAKNFSKLMTDTKPGISENTNQEKKNDSRKHSWTYQFQTTHTHERMQEKFLKEVRENHTFLQNTQPVLLKMSKSSKTREVWETVIVKRSLGRHDN